MPADSRPAAVPTSDAPSIEGLLPAAQKNLARWLHEPQYAAYVPGILKLIAENRIDELNALFYEQIPFGTGGRRGPMAEFGSATMNARTIAESAHGLATYLKQQAAAEGRSTAPGVLRGVVACDTRHRSEEFARLTATTLAAHGLTVFVFPEFRSTPELSFAVRHLKCDVGAMISASHNPPADNGFKAYWSNGAQVLDPHDQGIITEVEQAGEIPTIDWDEAVRTGRIVPIGAEVDRAFLEAVAAMSLSKARDIQAIYTPLHGVGETSVYRLVQQVGFEKVSIFEPQRAPDGSFPNVDKHLPNPERPQVFGPAIAEAQRTGAGLVIASDPDADRLGVCVADSSGSFVHLSGNQVGALLTDYVLRKRAAAGTLGPRHYVIETLVTTRLTGTIARRRGVRAIDDLLVGFKHIARTMEREGPDLFVFGTEESIGYLAGTYARDKDATVAALYVLELAAELRAEGRTLLDRLDDLSVECGLHVEAQRSVEAQGPRGREQIAAVMAALREDPPRELAGLTFTRVRDYGRHEIRTLPENKRTADLPEPRSDLVFLETGTGGETGGSGRCYTVAARPSGTEPKIKFYFFGRADCPGRDALAGLKADVGAEFLALQDAWSEWVRRKIDG